MRDRRSSDRMVMHPTTDFQVGGSNPGRPHAGRAGRHVSSAQSTPHSNPSQHKLLHKILTCPHPPQKVISSFR